MAIKLDIITTGVESLTKAATQFRKMAEAMIAADSGHKKLSSSSQKTVKDLKAQANAAVAAAEAMAGMAASFTAIAHVKSPFTTMSADLKRIKSDVALVNAELASTGAASNIKLGDDDYMKRVVDAKALIAMEQKLNTEIEKQAGLQAQLSQVTNSTGNDFTREAAKNLALAKQRTAAMQEQLTLETAISNARKAGNQGVTDKVTQYADMYKAGVISAQEFTGWVKKLGVETSALGVTAQKSSAGMLSLAKSYEAIEVSASKAKTSVNSMLTGGVTTEKMVAETGRLAKAYNQIEVSATRARTSINAMLTGQKATPVVDPKLVSAQIAAVDKLKARLNTLDKTKLPTGQFDRLRAAISKVNIELAKGKIQTGPLADLSKKLSVMETGFKKSSTSMTKWGDNAKYVMGGVARSMGAMTYSYAALAPLLAGIVVGSAVREVYKLGTAFEYTTQYIDALADSLSTVKLDGIRDGLLGLEGLRKGPNELAAGMKEFAKAGVDAAVSLGQIAEMSKFASIAEIDLADAVKLVVGQSNAYGISFTEASNMIATSALSSATSIEELATALSYTTELATVSGTKFDEVATAMALMANAGIRGSKAATAIRTSVIKMQAPSDKLKNTLDELGISWSAFTDEGQVKGMRVMFAELSRVLKDVSAQTKVEVFKELFGLRAIKGGATIIRSLENQGVAWDNLNEKIKESTQGTSFIEKTYGKLDETVTAKLEKLGATFQRELIKSFDTDSTKGVLDNLQQILESGALSAGFGSVIESLNSTAEAVSTLITWMIKLGTVAEEAGNVLSKSFNTSFSPTDALGFSTAPVKALNFMFQKAEGLYDKYITKPREQAAKDEKFEKLGDEIELSKALGISFDTKELSKMAEEASREAHSVTNKIKSIIKENRQGLENEESFDPDRVQKIKLNPPQFYVDLNEYDTLLDEAMAGGDTVMMGKIKEHYDELSSKVESESYKRKLNVTLGMDTSLDTRLNKTKEDIQIINELVNIDKQAKVKSGDGWGKVLDKVREDTDKTIKKLEDLHKVKYTPEQKQDVFDHLKLRAAEEHIANIQAKAEEVNLKEFIKDLEVSGTYTEKLQAEIETMRSKAEAEVKAMGYPDTEEGRAAATSYIDSRVAEVSNQHLRDMAKNAESLQEAIDKINYEKTVAGLSDSAKAAEELNQKVLAIASQNKLGMEFDIDFSKVNDLDKWLEEAKKKRDAFLAVDERYNQLQYIIDKLTEIKTASQQAFDAGNLAEFKRTMEDMKFDSVTESLRFSDNPLDKLEADFRDVKKQAFETAKAVNQAGMRFGEMRFNDNGKQIFAQVLKDSKLFARALKDAKSELQDTKMSMRDMEFDLKLDMMPEDQRMQASIGYAEMYKNLAAEAAKTTNDGGQKQVEYLEKARSILLSMNKDQAAVTRGEVQEAADAYQLMLDRTGGGKRAWGTTADELERLKKEYYRLAEAYKAGEPDPKKIKDAAKAQLSSVEEINKEIIGVKEKAIKDLGGKIKELTDSVGGDFEGVGEEVDQYGVRLAGTVDTTKSWADNSITEIKRVAEAYRELGTAAGTHTQNGRGSTQVEATATAAQVPASAVQVAEAAQVPSSAVQVAEAASVTLSSGTENVLKKVATSSETAVKQAAVAAESTETASKETVAVVRNIAPEISKGFTSYINAKGNTVYTNQPNSGQESLVQKTGQLITLSNEGNQVAAKTQNAVEQLNKSGQLVTLHGGTNESRSGENKYGTSFEFDAKGVKEVEETIERVTLKADKVKEYVGQLEAPKEFADSLLTPLEKSEIKARQLKKQMEKTETSQDFALSLLTPSERETATKVKKVIDEIPEKDRGVEVYLKVVKDAGGAEKFAEDVKSIYADLQNQVMNSEGAVRAAAVEKLRTFNEIIKKYKDVPISDISPEVKATINTESFEKTKAAVQDWGAGIGDTLGSSLGGAKDQVDQFPDKVAQIVEPLKNVGVVAEETAQRLSLLEVDGEPMADSFFDMDSLYQVQAYVTGLIDNIKTSLLTVDEEPLQEAFDTSTLEGFKRGVMDILPLLGQIGGSADTAAEKLKQVKVDPIEVKGQTSVEQYTKALKEPLDALKQIVPMASEAEQAFSNFMGDSQAAADEAYGASAKVTDGVSAISEAQEINKSTVAEWAAKSIKVINEVIQAYSNLANEIERLPTGNTPSGRAAGGPVSGSSTYWVGEKGPELFTPGASGFITPNHMLPAISKGSSSVVDINLSINGSDPIPLQGPQTSVDQLQRAFEDKKRFAA